MSYLIVLMYADLDIHAVKSIIGKERNKKAGEKCGAWQGLVVVNWNPAVHSAR